MRALVVGNGPSLKQYSHADWLRFRSEYDLVVVVNRFFLGTVPIKPDVLCAVDTNVFREYADQFDAWQERTNAVLVLNSDICDFFGASWRHIARAIPVFIDYNAPYGSQWLSFASVVPSIPLGKNVMMLAIPAAAAMGATQIDLIGVDMTGYLHFYDSRDNPTTRNLNHEAEDPFAYHDSLKARVMQNFRILAAQLQFDGVVLQNVGPVNNIPWIKHAPKENTQAQAPHHEGRGEPSCCKSCSCRGPGSQAAPAA